MCLSWQIVCLDVGFIICVLKQNKTKNAASSPSPYLNAASSEVNLVWYTVVLNTTAYSQLSPCRHLAIADTRIIWTAAKSTAKINYRHLTEINSCY